ncbi:MAG TPA: crosslink repair DNA glycosylase YcaQ family protein, partial [Anaerolineae bacterium]
LLGYASRDLVIDPTFAKRIHPGGGIIHPVLLVNGQALGTWKTRRRRAHLELMVEPFESLAGELRPHIESEVADLARFLGEDVVLTIVDPITE